MDNFKINSKAFYSDYIFHPFKKELSSFQKAKAFIACFALGFFTIGLFQAGCYLKYRKSINANKPTIDNVNNKKMSTAAKNANITPDHIEEVQIKAPKLPENTPKGLVPRIDTPSETPKFPGNASKVLVPNTKTPATTSSTQNTETPATTSSTQIKPSNPVQGFDMTNLQRLYTDETAKQSLRNSPAQLESFKKQLTQYLNRVEVPKKPKVENSLSWEKAINEVKRTLHQGIIEMVTNSNPEKHVIMEKTVLLGYPEMHSYFQGFINKGVMGAYGTKRLHMGFIFSPMSEIERRDFMALKGYNSIVFLEHNTFKSEADLGEGYGNDRFIPASV